MRFDVDLHRYTIKLPDRLAGGKPLEMSVVDSGARDAVQTMVFIHGFGAAPPTGKISWSISRRITG